MRFLNRFYSPVVFATITFCIIVNVYLLSNVGTPNLKIFYWNQCIFSAVVTVFFVGNALDHSRIKKRISANLSSQKRLRRKKSNKVSRYLKESERRIKYDKPKVVIYTSGIKNVGYQTNMWLPVIERLGIPVGVVIRDLHIYKEVVSTDVPIYYFKKMNELECLVEAGVKTILYPANTMKNVQSLRFYALNHFFINHGESDKVVNQSKMMCAYDKILLAGDLAERRLKSVGLRFHEDQIVHVGRPQVELALEKLEEPKEKISTILYAPTWEGFVEQADYSSVSSFGLKLLDDLIGSGSYEILYKPHPFVGNNLDSVPAQYKDKLEELATNSDAVTFLGPSSNIHDLMNQSDLLITDISSVLNDYLYTQKPIILTNTIQVSKEQFLLEYPTSEAAYLLNPEDAVVELVKQIELDDNMRHIRKDLCVQSLGDFPEGSLARFANVICDSAK